MLQHSKLISLLWYTLAGLQVEVSRLANLHVCAASCLHTCNTTRSSKYDDNDSDKELMAEPVTTEPLNNKFKFKAATSPASLCPPSHCHSPSPSPSVANLWRHVRTQHIKPKTQGQGHRWSLPLPPPAPPRPPPRMVPPPTQIRRRRHPASQPSKAPHIAAAEKLQQMKIEVEPEAEHPSTTPLSHLLGGGLSSQQLIDIASFVLDAADQRFETEVEKRKKDEDLFQLGVDIGLLQAERLEKNHSMRR